MDGENDGMVVEGLTVGDVGEGVGNDVGVRVGKYDGLVVGIGVGLTLGDVGDSVGNDVGAMGYSQLQAIEEVPEVELYQSEPGVM